MTMNGPNYPNQNVDQSQQGYGQNTTPQQEYMKYPNGYPPPPPPNYAPVQQPVVVNVTAQNNDFPGKGKGTASMVLGIISLVAHFFGHLLSYIPYIGTVLYLIVVPLTFIGAIIGLVLGITAAKQVPPGKKGSATAGIVCCAVSIGLQILMGLLWLACFGIIGLACLGTLGSMEMGSY